VRTRFDPRLYQIAALSGLLAYGVVGLAFEVSIARVTLLLATALATQYVGGRLGGLPGFDPRSALISGLSLCLLLRTNSEALAAGTAVVAIASKFVLRWNGKHLFNPTNFGLVSMILATSAVWVSPGQWGSAAFLAFLVACLGGMVVNRAARSDVSLAFLASYGALLFLRAGWLGDPLSIPLHQLESGALLIFAFFMISDPKTTPDSRAGRVLFAILVAAGGAFVQFRLFRPNGLLWSLAALSPAVALIDRLFPGCRYDWAGRARIPALPRKGVAHAPALDLLPQLPVGRTRG
jgi:Na+-transporting NADH:ubiquinone oxidoreductase subunit NqrB